MAGRLPTSLQIERAARRGAARGLNRLGTVLLAGARRDAPVGPPGEKHERHGRQHPGALKRSGSRTTARPDDLTVTVMFPGPYAAPQEVHTEWKHPQGGKAHYLGDQVKAVTVIFLPVIAQFVKDEIESRLGDAG